MTSRLRDRRRLALVSLAALLAGTTLAACNRTAAPAGNETAQAPGTSPCGTLAPTQTSKLPTDPGTDQPSVDCSAWQAFIALNWKADPNNPGQPDPGATWANFGTPGDMSPVVWESYLEASAVFGGNGAALKGLWRAKRPAVKALRRTSKFGDLDLSAITQAGGDHWLTNQRGDVTYFEVMMNKDEFEFITQDGFDLTTAAGQLACATQPGKPVSDGPPIKPPYPPGTVLRGGLNFPAGSGAGWDDTDCAGNVHNSYGDDVGAMEIKAAWTPLPTDGSLNYRYKTAMAEILDPATKTTRTVPVGLVGLHIARKRFPRLPWVWATFEQIDNSPDEVAGGGFAAPSFPANPNQKPSPGYTFFNPGCTPQQDPVYKCQHNFPPTPCGTSGGTCQPYNAPMQITRLNPVGATANSVTAYVWNMLPAGSVFNYYRLVDVQWPQTGVSKPVPGPGLRVPLTMGDPKPAGSAGGVTQIVANTTLESFQQNSNSCMDCHANFASIASKKSLQAIGPGQRRKLVKTTNGEQPYASDYSFLFLTETQR